MAKVKLDFKRIEKVAIEAHKEVALLLHAKTIEVISEPGAFPSTPNDLIDTGLLRESQAIEFPKVGLALLSNSIEYSIYVYFGYTLRNGRVIEGRPWMGEAVKRLDIQKTFETILESKL